MPKVFKEGGSAHLDDDTTTVWFIVAIDDRLAWVRSVTAAPKDRLVEVNRLW
jgi:hypothetical protein